MKLYLDYLEEDDEDLDIELQDEASAIMGERELKEKHIGEILLSYTTIAMDYHSLLNVSKDKIVNSINKSKNKEKYKITQRFKNMTDEARDVEDLKKNLSLGEWSIGKSKAIFTYQGDMYDKDRNAMEADMLLEMKSNEIDDVSRAHDFIYKFEMLEKQEIANRIESEAYGLGTMAPDDDDYGVMDGDENY